MPSVKEVTTMKIKQTLIIQKLDKEFVIVPVGEAAKALHGMMRVNATGAAIIQSLVDGLDEHAVAAELKKRFDGVDTDRALKDVRDTVQKLRSVGLVEDD